MAQHETGKMKKYKEKRNPNNKNKQTHLSVQSRRQNIEDPKTVPKSCFQALMGMPCNQKKKNTPLKGAGECAVENFKTDKSCLKQTNFHLLVCI